MRELIRIGLTTWSEHTDLSNGKKPTLAEYASKFPLVEVDTLFYGIPRKTTVASWIEAVPPSFRFILKVPKAMTLHEEWQKNYESEKDLYLQFFESVAPLISKNQLYAFLFQFPPYFSCTKENILHLKKIRKIFKELPIAIEFRNAAWFSDPMQAKMIRFMQENQFILTIVDSPQLPTNAIPFLPLATHSSKVLIRCHGRNIQGWLEKGEDWRQKRTLYDYNEKELEELAEHASQLESKQLEVAIIFNNNSGGDAYRNATSLKNRLNIQYADLNPEQIDLF
ncbi:DUF72 domain-containing protein [Vagococcus entomophilus]|uniref:DUF72 domain-containing protein n=1 Tax=Vagococcus entomophilus TaxID=1160095 RepID=UPI001FE80B2C|nr:DUF72 domain-containing protein [Vagococcus entomophilus]